MTVGKASILNFSDKVWLAFLSSSLSCLECGKSTSTSTRLSLAKLTNASDVRTVLCKALQGGHQSEPLKSIKTIFFSAFALAWALDRSVTHSPSAALTCQTAQLASKHNAIFFIIQRLGSVRFD